MASKLLKTAKEVLEIEAKAIRGLIPKLGKPFEKTVALMSACTGRVVLTGMGKPGFIGRKIAATLASTGTPSLYLHPAEAIHGDLGMVTEEDIVMAISQSGETEEIIKLVPVLKKRGVALVAMTSNARSTLAKAADVLLDLGVTREACPLNLAPSASTTASLALGDALALSLHQKKNFRSEDFALFHPGGSLGKRLMKVKDLMRTGKSNPVVRGSMRVREVLLKITQARAGSCTVVDGRGRLVGVFTDGDLRRHLRKEGEGMLNEAIEHVATRHPTVIDENKLAAEAFHLLKKKKIDELPVVNMKGRVVGLLDVQDLLKAGWV